MHRKISILLIFSCFFFGLKAQLPVKINSPQTLQQESHMFRQKYRHTAIKPYFIQTNDTFFVHPAVETDIRAGGKGLFGITGTGGEVYYKKDKFAIWSALLGGLAINPPWWQKATFPQIGRETAINGKLNLWKDIRVVASYKTRFITFIAGRSKFHLGESFHSLWLSGYSPALPFIGARVDIGPIFYGYQIHWLQNPDLRFPDKPLFHAFNITHYLDFSLGPMNITMFETVVQDPIDSLGAHRGFDINYLNPVIFFRAVDLSLGSPDNVLLGLGGSLKILPGTQIYGYGLLDEMIVSQLRAGTHCWCLKYGLNAGIKSYDAFKIPGLYLQAEASTVRPYTYSHDNPILAYGNLYQPLAHPLGANFYESLVHLAYMKDKFFISVEASAALYGQDIDTLNYGKDIFRPYTTRIGDYGILTGQGNRTMAFYTSVSLQRKIFSNTWLKFSIIYRKENSSQPDSWLLLGLGLTSQLYDLRWDWH